MEATLRLVWQVTFGHDESRNSSGGDGRDDGVPLLSDADLAVPTAVSLGGREHVTSATHVAISCLFSTKDIKLQSLKNIK